MSSRSARPATDDRGEVLGALAVAMALQAVAGSCVEPEVGADPDDVLEAAAYVLGGFISDGRLSDPVEQRFARVAMLARTWQGFGAMSLVGPDRYARRDVRLEHFRRVGWAHTWARSPMPSSALGSVRLFRGAESERRDGIAWTDSRELAQWFAQRCGGRVWELCVPSSRMLCAFPIAVQGMPEATEFIVDTERLEVLL